MDLLKPKKEYQILPRVFVTLGDESKFDSIDLQCERCGEFRAPYKFQKNQCNPGGVAGYVRRSYCITCPRDEKKTSPVEKKRKYTYSELMRRLMILETRLADQNRLTNLMSDQLVSLIDLGDTTELAKLSAELRSKKYPEVRDPDKSSCHPDLDSNSDE